MAKMDSLRTDHPQEEQETREEKAKDHLKTPLHFTTVLLLPLEALEAFVLRNRPAKGLEVAGDVQMLPLKMAHQFMDLFFRRSNLLLLAEKQEPVLLLLERMGKMHPILQTESQEALQANEVAPLLTTSGDQMDEASWEDQEAMELMEEEEEEPGCVTPHTQVVRVEGRVEQAAVVVKVAYQVTPEIRLSASLLLTHWACR